MKKIIAEIILILFLTACTTKSSTEQEIIPETATIEPSATASPTATATPEVSQVDRMLENYLAGQEIDTSILSPAEFREFSMKLAEERNKERGINPVIYNNEAYISPDNYMMMNYDGHPDMNETIQMYLPVVGKDSVGNLQILNEKGQAITITNSADVDWNMVVTDPNDPRIDWPNLPKSSTNGLTLTEFLLSDQSKNKIFIVPSILLDKTMGQIFMEGRGKGMIPTLRFLTVADTDKNGVPISFRLSLVIANTTQLAIEDSDFQTSAHGVSILEKDTFYKNLQENSVYYMGLGHDQDLAWDQSYNTTMDAYQGLIADNEIVSILNHQKTENMQNMMLLPPTLLIQKK